MPRIGIIGAGGMGRTHARSYTTIPGAQVVAVADPISERARSVAELCGAQPFPSVEALLEAGAPDVIDICVPTPQHVPVAMTVLEAGIPTIIEKPVARTLADGRALAAAYRAKDVRIAPAQVVRFFPDFFDTRRSVLEGAVGNPAVVRVTRGGAFPRGSSSWYGDPDQSGGVIYDLMVHDFDWLRWTFGEVERVTASSLMTQGVRDRDYALAVLRHSSGVISHVEGTWAHSDGFRTQIEVSGDRGVLQQNSQHPPVFRLRREEPEVRVAVPVPESPVAINPYTAELSELLAYVTGGADARVTIEDGLAALEIAEACWRSAETGAPVSLPLA